MNKCVFDPIIFAYSHNITRCERPIKLFKFIYTYSEVSRVFIGRPVTSCFWADRLHLGVLPPLFRHHGWRKCLNLVPPDALKMHSLAAVPVLRFLCKTFSKLRELNKETLFSVDA